MADFDFTQDWSTRHFPKWQEVLKPFAGREKIRALELGSFEGRSAVFFLENVVTHPTAKLICIDHWRDSAVYRRFLGNLLACNGQDRCEVRRSDTHQMLRGMKQRFDFVYVDADHRADAVLTDAVLCWSLLNIGGVLIFDDYRWERPGVAAPKIGIDAFMTAFEGQYEILHMAWQVILKKK